MNELNNLVSIQIPKKDLDAAADHLKAVYALLEPYLIALTAEERRMLPKMSERNAPFVEKTLQYAQESPELAPGFLNIKELDIDVKAVNDLASLFRMADKLCSGLNDTMMLAGSEAFMAALAYYNSVKSDRRAVATKMNVSGAKRIYEDLNKRFDRTVSRAAEGEE